MQIDRADHEVNAAPANLGLEKEEPPPEIAGGGSYALGKAQRDRQG